MILGSAQSDDLVVVQVLDMVLDEAMEQPDTVEEIRLVYLSV